MEKLRKRAACPFCGRLIDVPREIKTALGDNILGGRCECGAVYAFDRSGRNLGQTYVDVLNFACEGRYDNPWELIPGEDYQEALLYYDPKNHTLTDRGGRSQENMCFILLKNKL